LFLGSCATSKKAYVANEDEEYYGKSDKPRWYGTFTITDKWADSEGNIWYKTIVINQIGVSRYVLNRITGHFDPCNPE
jgi:hypothetical protein